MASYKCKSPVVIFSTVASQPLDYSLQPVPKQLLKYNTETKAVHIAYMDNYSYNLSNVHGLSLSVIFHQLFS